MRFCIVFICQQGELELKSLLLAASLRRHLTGDCELAAALPGPAERWGTVSGSTLAALGSLGVKLFEIQNSIDPGYAIGNKVACLQIETTADWRIFMDSDMLCLGPWHPEDLLAGTPDCRFLAKPADFDTSGLSLDHWRRVYGKLGLDLPSERLKATVSREIMLPYFNTGMIMAKTGKGFGATWEDCCRRIDTDPDIPNKRPWLDQMALPVALKKCGLPYACLENAFNFPAHKLPLPDPPPVLCHYHWPEVIQKSPRLLQAVRELVGTLPALDILMHQHSSWQALAPEAGGHIGPPLQRDL